MAISEANKAQLVQTGIKVGVPVVLGTGIFFIIRSMLKGDGNDDGTKHSQAPSIADMTIDSSNLTITVNDAVLIAQTFYNNMQGFGTVDEEGMIRTINNLQTKDDMLLLIKSFGLRRYSGVGKSIVGKKVNLIYWLKEEFNDREEEKIRPVFQKFGIPF